MITQEQMNDYMENGFDDNLLLKDDEDLVSIWEKYESEDPRAICGTGTAETIEEINYTNAWFAKTLGGDIYLNSVDSIIDIGAGYNSCKKLIAPDKKYTPCDIIKMTDDTVVMKNGELPFEDDSFDCAWCSNVFQHLTPNQRLKYITEMIRVTKPKSKIYFNCMIYIPGLFVPLAPFSKLRNRYFAITGDYLNPLPNAKEFYDWRQNIATVSLTATRNGAVGFWMENTKHYEEQDACI